jgi:hypothetical protein
MGAGGDTIKEVQQLLPLPHEKKASRKASKTSMRLMTRGKSAAFLQLEL